MASQPLHPTPQPVTLPGDMDPRDLFRLMSCFDPRQLAGFVDVAIGLIDLSEGDPDLEDNADREASDGDDQDVGWTEFHTRGRFKMNPGVLSADGQPLEEDDEDYDAAEDDDFGEEDDPSGLVDEDGGNTVTQRGYFGLPIGTGPGCTISDDDSYGMQHDVPTLRVVALEPNIFTGAREFLGMSNLLTSFHSSGQTVRSADTGNAHRRLAGDNRALGVPV